ncbi:MAG TPA: hypothetical protein VG962_16025 [Steroidobacteraceae bacterium]|nr:hypothetical protein [Steroidobacteraceae bacterium]
MHKTSAALILLTLSGVCTAGGTLDEGELMTLLDQKPQIKEFVLQNFDMPKGAWAEIQLSSQYKYLAGKRLGPYTIPVTPKGNPILSSVVLTLCTSYVFIDRNGKPMKAETPDTFKAAGIKETLVSVQIRQASEAQNPPVCP